MWKPFISLSLFCSLLCAKLTTALCPNVCTCDIDANGRKRTRCENGGISIPGNFDLMSLDPDTRVLIITGTPARQNVFSLNAQMFIGKQYQEIHLSFSQMDYIGERTFTGVERTLTVLNLTHNSLRAMSENNFRNLSRLTDLYLDYNRIASVHSAMFAYLTSLRVLTITNNQLNDVPQRMGLQLAKLEVLDMSNNPIGIPVLADVRQTIPDIFFVDFPNLRVLGLANTSLDSLPWLSIQRNNPRLEELDLSNNKMQQLLPGEVALLGRNLKRFKIGQNPNLRSIAPGALAGLALDSLDLSGLRAANVLQPGVFQRTKVSNLDVSYTGLIGLDPNVFLEISPDLVGLNISGNPQMVIQPNMFQIVQNLVVLTMANMQKTAVPVDLFGSDNKLTYLDMSGFGLLALEDGFFSRLSGLETLILANNQLARVPASINLPRVQTIDLSSNRLRDFPDVLIQAFAAPSSTLRTLKLNMNPWNCDCGVASLGRWLTSTHSNPGFQVVCQGNGTGACPVCQDPGQYRGTALNQLPATFLDTCAPITNSVGPTSANVDVIIAVVVCLIVLIIAILLLVLWYRNRLHSYRTYEEKRKDGDTFEHNGDVGDVFEEVPPISKPKNGLPSAIHVAPPTTALPKQESNV